MTTENICDETICLSKKQRNRQPTLLIFDAPGLIYESDGARWGATKTNRNRRIQMNIRGIYSDTLVDNVTAILNAKCVGGAAVTRAKLCNELGLTEPLTESSSKETKSRNLAIETVIGSLITLDVISGFESRLGALGGYGKVGEKQPAAPKEPGTKKVAKPATLPAGFLDKLKATLIDVCAGGKRVIRRDIAKAMGMPGLDNENFISSAIAQGLLPGYDSRQGVKGGIGLAEVKTETPAVEESAADKQVDVAQAETVSSGEDEVLFTDTEVEADIEAELAAAAPADESEAATIVVPAAPKRAGRKSRAKSKTDTNEQSAV